MRGQAPFVKAHLKGSNEDYVVLIGDMEAYNKWKTDKSVAAVEFLAEHKVFITHKQGAQGVLDAASNQILDAEFGTHNQDECCLKILEDKNTKVEESKNAERGGDRNVTAGPAIAH